MYLKGLPSVAFTLVKPRGLCSECTKNIMVLSGTGTSTGTGTDICHPQTLGEVQAKAKALI